VKHYIAAVKAGKLTNGYELGKGRKIHLVPVEKSYCGYALCGDRPAIQWSERELDTVNCSECMSQLSWEVSNEPKSTV
jgi:hypothetical protein